MDRRAAVKLIKALYDARSHGDLAAVEKLITPDASLQQIGSPEHNRMLMQASGSKEFVQAVKNLSEALELSNFEIITLLVDGPKIAVHLRCDIRHLGSDRSAKMDLWTSGRPKTERSSRSCRLSIRPKRRGLSAPTRPARRLDNQSSIFGRADDLRAYEGKGRMRLMLDNYLLSCSSS
jgi:ketosteroid isomerase-like protein